MKWLKILKPNLLSVDVRQVLFYQMIVPILTLLIKLIILMISLQDEISKFQKLVYNKQLAEFVTVDQMFVGGGITMESLINQNSFIVQQLKKMNAVFRNFCKLNEKVYSKIIEHELGMHTEQARLNGVINVIDRKLQDTVKTIKILHSETIKENHKSITCVNVALEPIKEELNTKVDQVTFALKMKQVLEQYDEGGLQKEEGFEGQRIISATGEIISNSLLRKKGKVSFDQFYRLKEELQNRVKIAQQKLALVQSQSTQSKQLFFKYIPVINKNSAQILDHTTEIYQINGLQTQQFANLNNSLNKLQTELNNRLSENVWNSKFEGFHDKHMKPILHQLGDTIQTNYSQLKALKSESGLKFNNIHSEFGTIKIEIDNLQTQLEKTSDELFAINHTIEQMQKKNKLQFQIINKKIEEISQQLTKSMNEQLKINQNKFKQLNRIIQLLSQNIQQTVLKAVNKKIEVQLRLIQSQIKQNRSKTKHLRKDIEVISQQVKNIKDILARKANFTDIILHVEKKVDKEDFKQFQFKIHQTSQQFASRNLNDSINMIKYERVDSNRKNSSIRTSKTLLTPQVSPNRQEKTQLDSGTKLFMCGFEGHLGDNRKLGSSNSKRKNLKSSSGVVSDFAL